MRGSTFSALLAAAITGASAASVCLPITFTASPSTLRIMTLPGYRKTLLKEVARSYAALCSPTRWTRLVSANWFPTLEKN